MARVFFAVSLCPEVSSAFRSLGSYLRGRPGAEGLRFVDADQAHVTIRFLGEQAPEGVAAAARAGQVAAAGFGAFDFELGPLGVFPDERRPHTLWVGVASGASALIQLARRLATCLADEGFAGETRPFVPHLTLARVKRAPKRDEMRALLVGPGDFVASQRVESFALMESLPDGGRVRYIRRETFSLEMSCTPSRSPSTAAPKS